MRSPFAIALSALAFGLVGAARLMDWPDLLARPMPHATQRIAYGQGANQLAELWLPDGPGPHPVVGMVHGGCWRARVANLSIMNWAAEDLRRRGVAVWNIEYRGVDQAGGGWPGTFEDVAAAADALRPVAAAHDLSLARVVAVGHSAGGHLAMWLAARPRLPAGSPLASAHPLPIAAVVSLGGLPDLAADKAAAGAACGPAVIDALAGAEPGAARPLRRHLPGRTPADRRAPGDRGGRRRSPRPALARPRLGRQGPRRRRPSPAHRHPGHRPRRTDRPRLGRLVAGSGVDRASGAGSLV